MNATKLYRGELPALHDASELRSTRALTTVMLRALESIDWATCDTVAARSWLFMSPGLLAASNANTLRYWTVQMETTVGWQSAGSVRDDLLVDHVCLSAAPLLLFVHPDDLRSICLTKHFVQQLERPPRGTHKRYLLADGPS